MGALQNGGLALPLNLCKGRWRRRLFSLGQAGSCWWQLQPRCFSGEEICSSWCRWGDGNRNLRRGLQAGSLNPERSVTQSPVKLRKNFACVLWSFAVFPSTYPGGTQGFIKPSETFVDACQTSPGHVRADFSVHHRDKGLFRADSWGGRGGASPPSPLLLLGSSANLYQLKPHLSLTWIASPPSLWGVPRLARVHHDCAKQPESLCCCSVPSPGLGSN